MTNPKVYEQGRLSERLVHEEQRRKVEAQLESKRQVSQAEIDSIEKEYYDRDKQRQLELSSLEALLLEEQLKEDTLVLTPPSKNSCPVLSRPPAVPRSLSDALNNIGRGIPPVGEGASVP